MRGNEGHLVNLVETKHLAMKISLDFRKRQLIYKIHSRENFNPWHSVGDHLSTSIKVTQLYKMHGTSYCIVKLWKCERIGQFRGFNWVDPGLSAKLVCFDLSRPTTSLEIIQKNCRWPGLVTQGIWKSANSIMFNFISFRIQSIFFQNNRFTQLLTSSF